MFVLPAASSGLDAINISLCNVKVSSRFTSMESRSLVNFSGHQYLRQRLVLSILTGKHVRIDKIRSEDKDPGLRGVSSSLQPGVSWRVVPSPRLRSQPPAASRKSHQWVRHWNLSDRYDLLHSITLELTYMPSRYRCTSQTRSRVWRSCYSWLSIVTFNRLFFGTTGHDRALLKEAVSADIARHNNRW